MSPVAAMVNWRVGSQARARCFVFDDLPPILDASDRDGFALSISSAGTVMTREGAAFAKELAVAAQRYAAECTRMVSAGSGAAATPPGSGATPLGIPDEALTEAGMAFREELDRATARTPTGDPRHAYPDEVVAAAVAGAAPVVVACELRRLVTEVGGDAGRYGWVWALTAPCRRAGPWRGRDRPVSTPAATDAGAGGVLLVCTDCDHAWEVTPDDMAGEAAAAGATGCPRCDGWTWLGELTTGRCPGGESNPRRSKERGRSDAADRRERR